MFKDKTIILGITGSIAAYKIASLASMLVKNHADVHVVMTNNAQNFINPITFETLTSNRCLTDTFDRSFTFHVGHVSLGKKADAMLIAPATANIIGKLACGIADDMLTTTALACKCPMLIAPAMNTAMYENPIVSNNISTLKSYGWEIISPASGYLACGDTGTGKMVEPAILFDYLTNAVLYPKDMLGLKVLVTAGPTQESLDPVRFLTNHSTGKMGYAIASACAMRGAAVTLVSGPVNLSPPLFLEEYVPVVSSADMYREVTSRFSSMDIVIKAAAVADYTPARTESDKIKKSDDDMSLALSRTQDILGYLGNNKKPGQFLCGFSMETRDLINNSRKKLQKKNLDLIAANNLKVEGAGFGTDTNVLTLISSDDILKLPLMSKIDVSNKLIDKIMAMRG